MTCCNETSLLSTGMLFVPDSGQSVLEVVLLLLLYHGKSTECTKGKKNVSKERGMYQRKKMYE